MALSKNLLIADVMHKRHFPKENGFVYKVYYLCFPLSHLNPPPLGEGRVREKITNKILSLNKFNIFSFYFKDYGKRDGSDIEKWIRKTLLDFDIKEADGEVILLTLPRILGYAFNPVSFWFCLDKQGNLRAVLSEVSNTFGEHHNYISFHDDKRIITKDDWIKGEKVFHVSPFMDIDGHYEYRFSYSTDKIGVWINHYNENGLMLSTSVTGKRQELNTKSLLFCFLRYPLVTLKVITLIHYQAIKIIAKGIKYRKKPALPKTEISR
jgi:uncharacterized protein